MNFPFFFFSNDSHSIFVVVVVVVVAKYPLDNTGRFLQSFILV